MRARMCVCLCASSYDLLGNFIDLCLSVRIWMHLQVIYINFRRASIIHISIFGHILRRRTYEIIWSPTYYIFMQRPHFVCIWNNKNIFLLSQYINLLLLLLMLFPSTNKSLLHFYSVAVCISTQLRRIYVTRSQWIALTDALRFCLYSHGLRTYSPWPNFENVLPSTWQIKYICVVQPLLRTYRLDLRKLHMPVYTLRDT